MAGIRWGIGHSAGLIVIAIVFFALKGGFDLDEIGLYCDYIVEHLPYAEVVRKVVRAFEGALPRAKKTGDAEFNLTLHLYQSTIRSVCRSMNLIFKIEKK